MLSIAKRDNHVEFTLKEYSDTYNPALCQKYQYDYLRSSGGVSEVLKKNAKECKKLLGKTKDLDFEKIYAATKENPVFMITECTAEECGLNRLTRGVFREFTEKTFVDIIKDKYSDKDIIIYTSFEPGNFFQDLVLLTLISEIVKKDCTLFLNLVGDTKDFLDLIFNSQYNPNVEKNLLTTNLKDDKEGNSLMVLRIIKLLEWFKGIHLNVYLNMYSSYTDYIDDCIADPIYYSDITVGIDYIDQSPDHIFKFQIMAICCTKTQGTILSLRTDGLAFWDSDINYHFEVYNNVDPVSSVEKYRRYRKELAKIENKSNKCIIYQEETKEQSKSLEVDGKTYNYTGYKIYPNGKRMAKYESPEYEALQKNYQEITGKMYLCFAKIAESSPYQINLHGENNFLIKSVTTFMKKSVTDTTKKCLVM